MKYVFAAVVLGLPNVAAGADAGPAEPSPTIPVYSTPGDEGGPGLGAMVHNPDFLGVWIATGGRDLQEAMHEAMKSCEAMVGPGCLPVGGLAAPAVAIGYGPEADLNFAVGKTPDEAGQNLDRLCRDKVRRPCNFTRTLALTERRVYEPADHRRRLYAALAGGWARVGEAKNDDLDHRIWVATGQASWDDAVRKAMEPCVAALGEAECRHFTASGDTHIAIYVERAGKSGGFVVNGSRQLVIADAVDECGTAGQQCDLIDIVTPQEEKVAVYDLLTLAGVPLPAPAN